jgi:hypothetical protein
MKDGSSLSTAQVIALLLQEPLYQKPEPGTTIPVTPPSYLFAVALTVL